MLRIKKKKTQKKKPQKSSQGVLVLVEDQGFRWVFNKIPQPSNLVLLAPLTGGKAQSV
jgi:hypothetical protein